MEELKAYKWFLEQICSFQITFKILETGICRGTKVSNWYCNSPTGLVISKSSKILNKTRYLINYFLNQRVPILEEYAPEKLICYLYHKNGKKIVTAKEAIELAENQLHGLQVTSIHMAVISNTDIISVYANNIGGELNTEIFTSKFGKGCEQPLKDSVHIEKIVNLLVTMSDFIIKISQQELQEISMDLVVDTSGFVHVIKILKLKLKENNARIALLRKSSIKLIMIEESSEEEAIRVTAKGAINFILEKEKKSAGLTVPISKPTVKNTQNFLQMMANTFDRDRRKQSQVEIIKSARDSASLPDKGSNFFPKRSFKESRTMKRSLNTLNDLLVYIEKTRPKIWLKDSGEVLPSTKSSNLNLPNEIVNRRQRSVQYFTPRAKFNHLQALISDDNRIGKKLNSRSHFINKFTK